MNDRVECRPGGRVARRWRLAQHQNAAPVGIAVLAQASILAILDPVGRAHRAADIGSVQLHRLRQRRLIALCHEALAHLVQQHEGGLVLNIKVTGHLQRRDALHRIGVQRDGAEVDLQRQLVMGEDGAGGDREGVATDPTAPLLAAAQKPVSIHRPTARADRVAVAAPADLAEQLEGFRLAQREDLPQRATTGGGRQQEVALMHARLQGAINAAQCAHRPDSRREPAPNSLIQKSCAAAT